MIEENVLQLKKNLSLKNERLQSAGKDDKKTYIYPISSKTSLLRIKWKMLQMEKELSNFQKKQQSTGQLFVCITIFYKTREETGPILCDVGKIKTCLVMKGSKTYSIQTSLLKKLISPQFKFKKGIHGQRRKVTQQ